MSKNQVCKSGSVSMQRPSYNSPTAIQRLRAEGAELDGSPAKGLGTGVGTTKNIRAS